MKIFIKNVKPYITILLVSVICILSGSRTFADPDLVSIFPLDHYDQNISTWIRPNDADYDARLLSAEMQQKRLDIFYDHFFGSSSPWNADYVNLILRQSPPDDLKTIEQALINNFDNENKPNDQIGYGENFRSYQKDWIQNITNNINLSQLDGLTYQATNRAITIDNLHARILPTADVHFYDYKVAGQGFPFDNLQISALWAGTPVYIIGETHDQAWMLVITPDFIGWVESKGIARVDNTFVDSWTTAAKNKLAAITHTRTSLIDNKGQFLFSAYVGSVFPAKKTATGMQMLVPVADADHNAVIKQVIIAPENAVFMPIALTPHHVADIMSTLIGRTYGWGSMYFYNDCSAELKSLFTPFGIWLPRHSSDQVTAGKMIDMSSASADKRISYLIANGQRFLTLIYIGGHVVMYVGNYPNPNDKSSLMAMTYQNVWGLRPNPSTRRAIIGKSVLFPMLLQYPEDPSLQSLASKTYFQVSYLNQLPTTLLLNQTKTVNLKSLMNLETSN